MRNPGRTLSVLVTGTVLAAGVVTACDDHTAMRIPPGAQQVRVVGTGTEVRLDPPTVRAGDIYFVIDGPVLFMQHSAAVPLNGDYPDPLMVRSDLCYRDPVACAALPPLPVAVLEVLP